MSKPFLPRTFPRTFSKTSLAVFALVTPILVTPILVSPRSACAQGATANSATRVSATKSPQTLLLVDNFENGVDSWTRNDKARSDNAANPVSLVDIVSTRPTSGLPFSSRGAALFSFKSAKNSWASASLRVDGARWANIGARTLTFWLNADGAPTGTELVLRAAVPSANGGTREESYSMPVRLNVRQWRQVTIPLADVRNEHGALLPNLHSVYLMQFVQRGNWESRFFTVDQIEVEGSGTPLSVSAATSVATPEKTPTNPKSSTQSSATNASATATNTLDVAVDFLKLQGRVTTSADVSLGATDDSAGGAPQFPLLTSKNFRDAMTVLRPRFIRIEAASLVAMTDSSKPSFDFSRLTAHVKQARALGAEPLIALSNEAAWGLDARGFAAFCAQAARAVNSSSTRTGADKGAQRFEIMAGANSPNLSDAEIVALYNSARAAIKAISPLYRVGGVTSSGTHPALVAALIRGAQGLDFLTLQFYAASSGKPDAGVLFGATRSLGSLRASASLLDKSRFKMAPIYVTSGNLNGAVDADSGSASDERVTQMISGAWWLSYAGNASRVADAVFHNDAVNASSGLLNPEARAYPAYYAMWMWNTYAPRGSERVQVSAPSSGVAAFAVNVPHVTGVPRSHNVLLANTRDSDTTIKVAIRGFAVLRAVQMQALDNAESGVRTNVVLPKSAFQTITLKPYSIAVLQFIEPPKK